MFREMCSMLRSFRDKGKLSQKSDFGRFGRNSGQAKCIKIGERPFLGHSGKPLFRAVGNRRVLGQLQGVPKHRRTSKLLQQLISGYRSAAYLLQVNAELAVQFLVAPFDEELNIVHH